MRHPCRGFTLLELLVAIVLATGVTVASTFLARSALEHESRHAQRWAWQADIRNSRLLLEHYWKRHLHEHLAFNSQSLLLSVSEGGKQYFIGFACEGMDNGHGSLSFYRWFATHEEKIYLQEGGAWPTAARQTLINDLGLCRFSLLQPPPADDREASSLWVERWVQRDRPHILRFDASSARGEAIPPMIVSATPQ